MTLSTLDISAAGLRAQRIRMEIIANNLANAETTAASQEVTPDGNVTYTPYRRKQVAFQIPASHRPILKAPQPMVVDDPGDFRLEHQPQHPHADAKGYVRYPNINPIVEFVDMIQASRAYEANVTAIDVLKTMDAATLKILA